jgi:glycosyltransferase involved in cell wall biosynthesis
MSKNNLEYVLITPARNEEAYIEKTIKSVISQTILPKKWVIVSDGSTDRTDEIIANYLSDYGFIQLLRREGDNQRNFGSQVRAINAGYEKMQGIDYVFIGNLDADVSFQPDYFEIILKRFEKRPSLGLAGGSIYEERDGKFIARQLNRTSSVAHAIQLFRRSCYEDIGGYLTLKYGGPDWHAEVTARMKNWEVQSFTDLSVYHHKPTLTAEGKLKGGFRQGRMDYSLGSNPLFEIFKCIIRIRKPYGFLYSSHRLAGFILGYLICEKRPVSKEFIKQLRKEQKEKIMDTLTRKKRIFF